MISCCGELISIDSSFSCFSTPACGSVHLVGAELGILFISLFSLIAHVLQCFFTRNYIWRWIFQFLIATKVLKLFCPLFVWINIKWITTISSLQWKFLKQFLLMMETDCFDMVYLILLSNADILISSCLTSEILCFVACFFLVTRVDINAKT